ncbi:MAG: ATP-binding protein [Terriglobia bacterium]
MSDLAWWQKNNQHYLAAALTWLRLRLERQKSRKHAAGQLPSSEPEAEPAPDDVPDEQVAQAAAAVANAEVREPPPALIILSQRFGLSRFEQEILLLCAAMEFDTRIASLCARAQDDPSRPYPTFALAMALFDDPAWDVLSPERPLRYWRLIEINQPGAQPLTTSALRADERIVNYVKGLNYLDDRLAPLLVPFDVVPGEAELPPSQQTAVTMAVRQLQQAATTGQPPLIQLLGPDVLSKQLVARHAAAGLGLQLYRLPAELLPTHAAELETLARLWQRESILLPIALYLDAHEAGGPTQPEGQSPPLHRFLARSHGIFFLGTREIRSGLGPTTVGVEVDKPTSAEQRAVWTDALASASAQSPDPLAGQFNLNVPTIRQIARLAAAEASSNGGVPHDKVWDACLVNTRPRMDLLAQRLDTKATWGDIVLPEEAERLLRQLAAQVGQRSKVYDQWGFRKRMNRGLGISALFAGESGTGKTMAAEVIANDLRLNLYRIDLAGVVSKYIGETEKNLRRLFDAAEDGGAILFFDEADALCGKRSEVKDSHDRYANIEINYLLQRMETYRGLAILATNMKSALDTAFLRRLRFIVNFPFPSIEDRKRIWQKVFPPQTPTAGLDMGRLARLNLTGGSVHNVALNAAFQAAQAGTPVSMPLVLAGARVEFRKLERPITEADFRWQPPAGVGA